MGRLKPSSGLAPVAWRKDARAKKAKATINKVIPALLTMHPRARTGVDCAELITPATIAATGTSAPTAPPGTTLPRPRITLRVTGTLTAAHSLLTLQQHSGDVDLSNKRAKVAIPNMASPLSPGGGFLNGATSQEESLCMRTTLLPSLRDTFYRLPEVAAVYTPDVLVFRDEDAEDLAKRDRWFVDCVTAAMLRQPDTEPGVDGSPARYAHAKDRDLVLQKMRHVMAVFRVKGAKRIVLGAWGCGAYGNPVDEVAAAWKHVLLGGKQPNLDDSGIEEVTFAINDRRMAERFCDAFGDAITIVEAADSNLQDEDCEEEASGEVESKIDELEQSLASAKTPGLREGLSRALASLREQLHQSREASE
ncbi:hypothetical protein QBC39DRAFT_101338 [Podospora conica]|nr:hypothetical protein QBC39DRAFT_101338 [Schizothecium conicum]